MKITTSALLLSALLLPAHAKSLSSEVPNHVASADIIRSTFQDKLYTLSPFKEGHFGLRMYRQTLDPQYKYAIWSDMARVASRLNRFSEEVHTPEQIHQYAINRLSHYLGNTDERSLRRFNATKAMPEYMYLGIGLLGSMARANEYGLKHKDDKMLREIIRRYDFTKYVTNPTMIEAWAAQLANQVYWLRQLGEQDVVDEFIENFKATYPDERDAQLTKQQFGNKLYGMTHIILADSGYYQYPVSEREHQWIYDYLRKNIDTILLRSKEDVIAEVGIAFLLAGLDDDPVVQKTRDAIQASINFDAGLVPSVLGNLSLSGGEHRNVLAIMLLDWRGTNAAPKYGDGSSVLTSIPYGLEPKTPALALKQ
ncbi:hypothetical protein VINI7043_19343 [Vibrio nigripulchritudo ATCC 27043]|uniref:DUF3541 domain-containing protein n=1 Tax=Vibrio nigripulchritudo TaxID=28173 RepID=UPI00021C3E12|nr:DUF3541 domain-containing protein [Vibrio nigripulchritudo]EGU61306.1 hypothetical protein VINI7043_19343 [Vibrio nigripulchritudo ATCC 27043]